ncbi:methyl-accepting chemotaxis protein (partial), partial [Bordetella avium 197N]
LLSRLKIRTGLLIVLIAFSLVFALSAILSQLLFRAADEAVDNLHGVATEHTRPLYETQALLLRTRITLVAAYLDVLDGRDRQAQEFAQQASGYLDQARRRHAIFQNMPKLNEASQQLGRDIATAYNNYERGIAGLRQAIQQRSARLYEESTTQTSLADAQFEQLTRAFLSQPPKRGELIHKASDERYDRSVLLAIVMLSLGVLLAFACWVFINRQLGHPLSDATGQGNRSAADLRQRIEARPGHEICTFFSALRRM